MREINVNGPAKKPAVPKIPEYIPRKRSFIAKVFSVVVDDIKSLVIHKDVMMGKEPEGWQDYKRFCEMARGKK